MATVVTASVQQERTHFHHMLAKNPNYFGNIPGSKFKPNLKIISNPTYEQLTCVGYNPDTMNMEATFSINKPAGYSGTLCKAGSFEYVRFYLDFHDGAGFIDQGSVAVNVHDLPDDKDCLGKTNFPLKYTATLKKTTKKSSYCDNPVLPTLRAILSWGVDPPADSPNWTPVWGNVMNRDVQLKASLFNPIDFPFDLSEYLSVAKNFPHLTTTEAMEIAGIDLQQLSAPVKQTALPDQIKRAEKLKVPAARFAYKTVQKMIKYPTSEITLKDAQTLRPGEDQLRRPDRQAEPSHPDRYVESERRLRRTGMCWSELPYGKPGSDNQDQEEPGLQRRSLRSGQQGIRLVLDRLG